MRVVGIDGTKGGWVAIVLDDGRFVADLVIRPVKASFEEVSDARVVAVDIPIGYGPRDADAAARAFLTGAASTVFTTPRREMLEVPFGPGLGVSAQAHALGPRIVHVTNLASVDPAVLRGSPRGVVPGDERRATTPISEEVGGWCARARRALAATGH